MLRALAFKFALSLAIVLILGQLQCAAACVSFFSAQAVNQSLPPCHRHHDSKHSGDSSDACSHEISTAGVVTLAVSSPAPELAAIRITIDPQLASAPHLDAAITIATPPGSSVSAVLRI